MQDDDVTAAHNDSQIRSSSSLLVGIYLPNHEMFVIGSCWSGSPFFHNRKFKNQRTNGAPTLRINLDSYHYYIILRHYLEL